MDWSSLGGSMGGGGGGPVSSAASSGVSFGADPNAGTHTDLATVAGFAVVAVIILSALFLLRK